jgi:branched-chain amino acid transport system permease protein
MYWVGVIVNGIAFGAVSSLSAIGVVLTYKATGVFNFAHGAIALLAAYLLWQLNGDWGWPLAVAAPLVLLVVCPAIGLGLERLVFRPLQARRASTSEKLVATLGVLTLILGAIFGIWGREVRGDTTAPVPRLLPANPLWTRIGFDTEELGRALLVVLVGAGLFALLHFTFLGTRIRAVVDRRELAQLASIDANRVAGLSWALGATLAGLTGVLLAPPALEPTRLILLVIETFSVAVMARLVSLPLAVATGIGLLGVGNALVNEIQLSDANFAGRALVQLKPNLSVILLFAALLLYRRLDEVGEAASTGSGLVSASIGRRVRRVPPAVPVLVAAAVLLPLFLDEFDMVYAHQGVAMAVIFASIVTITGFSGHITLGQASIAGLGAFFSARAVNALGVPVVVGMLVGGAVALLAGLVAGYPALRRRGLFLGLTTLSLALLIFRFVLDSPLFNGGPGGLVVRRPAAFRGPWAFYWFELAVAGAMFLLARNVRSGPLGRILGAMRDSETAARSVGIDLRRYKLFIFAVSSFMAGVGGALLVQAQGAWDSNTFQPLFGLFWFTAVIVAGVSSLSGAALAAVIYVTLPIVLGTDILSAQFFLGLAALFVGRLPGGLVGALGRLPAWARTRLAEAYRDVAREARAERAEPVRLQPSPFARRVLAEGARR